MSRRRKGEEIPYLCIALPGRFTTLPPPMKAERRHDLKTNTLAREMQNLPQLWRQHGNKLLLVLIGIMLIIIVIRYRLTESAQRESSAKTALTKAEAEIAEIKSTPYWLYTTEDAIVGQFSQQAGFAEDDISEALRSADDPQLRAQAYVARGDLNLLWAGFPTLPAATTRPSLAPPHSRDEYLNNAEAAYNEALKGLASRQTIWNAHVGLAYVAEDRGEWDAAKRNYETVINDSATPTSIKDYAKQREEQLADMSRKRFSAALATEPALSTTGPTLFGPAAPETEPSSVLPTTRPAGPTAAPQIPATSSAKTKGS